MANTTSTTAASFNPAKRVNYATGMVLGVDDFKQEQGHFLAANRLHTQVTEGYGTLCGLHVSVDEDYQIVITEGLAIDLKGRLIRVAPDQCANLNEWLASEANRASRMPAKPSTPSNATHRCKAPLSKASDKPCSKRLFTRTV